MKLPAMNYCSSCGARVTSKIPPDDDRPRFVCDACETVHYQNPKIVVGCVPEREDAVLLCRRAINPRYGFWTLPAGFLENGETTIEGVQRETFEEAHATIEIISLYTVFDFPRINQVYMMFRSRLLDFDHEGGSESLEVKLFKEQDIPWDRIAFVPIYETLKLFFKDRRNENYPLRLGAIASDAPKGGEHRREVAYFNE
jgi:ADP-ribose pyrophosphatase YjhB (NUDIX family)